MATEKVEHPTAEDIRQQIKNRILDLDDEERDRKRERSTLERALAALNPNPGRRGPGRPRKAA